MLEIKNLTLGYKDKQLARGVNLTAREGEFIALVGRNGSGKSTLLRSLASLTKPLGGAILLDGRPFDQIRHSERARMISLVTKESVQAAHLRVWDTVALGRAPYSSWSGNLSQGDVEIVHHALVQVGMTDFATKNMDTLSDGERGRVMIARALAQETPLILLDEPTAFLDLPNRYHIFGLLRDLAKSGGKTIILSTHELNIAMEFADTLWVVAGGGVASGGPQELQTAGVLEAITKL